MKLEIKRHVRERGELQKLLEGLGSEFRQSAETIGQQEWHLRATKAKFNA